MQAQINASDFRKYARSLYISHETIDYFLENASVDKLKIVMDVIEFEHTVREKK